MPTSRNRRSRNRSTRYVRRERARRARAGRSGPGAPASSGFRATEDVHLHESLAAEAAGDAEGALVHLEAIRPFLDNPHRVMLRQLVELGDAVPTWGYARWIVEQATHWITADTVARMRLARDGTIRAAHAVDVDPRRPYGMRVEEFCGLMLGKDWIFRQLAVFEYDGLSDFLKADAGPELVARAGPVREWVDCPMGGFRFEGEGDGRSRITDLGSGAEIDVLDLGCAGQLEPGDCAIGRVVPIDTEPGLMFESAPLPVDAALAARVAADPDRWLKELTDAYEAGRLPPLYSWREQHPLLTYVPIWLWRYAIDDDAGLMHALEQGPPWSGDVVGDAVFVCREMLGFWDRVPPEGRPCLAQLFGAAVLHPGVMAALRESVTSARREQAFREVAAHLVDPMRGRVLELADLGGKRPDAA